MFELIEFIVPLIVSLAPIIVVITIVVRIVNGVKSVTRNYLGMTPSQTMQYISQGIREEANVPKPITSLTEVYMPKIQRDFPSMTYNSIESLAINALIGSLNAIENKSTNGLLELSCTNSLVNKINNIINDLNSQGEEDKYDNIKILKTGISSYKKTNSEATVIFECSTQFEYRRYKNGNLISSMQNNGLIGAAYKITLTYNHKAQKKNTNMLYSSNCPNCGAPIDVSLGNKECPYCGSGFSLIGDRVWQVSDFNLIT